MSEIKIGELKYGNLLYTDRAKENELIVVTCIGRQSDWEDAMLCTCMFPPLMMSQCKPIQLTEDWLSKFGFTYKKDNYLHNHETSYFTLTGNLPDNLDYYGGSGGIGAELKYVHQLQNLYFCLTGEELKLKE